MSDLNRIVVEVFFFVATRTAKEWFRLLSGHRKICRVDVLSVLQCPRKKFMKV